MTQALEKVSTHFATVTCIGYYLDTSSY